MQDDNRYDFITFGWIATIVGLLLFGALMDARLHREYQSTYYTRMCATVLPESPYGNTYQEKKPTASKDHQRDWCDLAAQQSVAEDTNGMYRLGWLGLLSSGFGIFLVWRTLLANQHATAAAIAAATTAAQVAKDAKEQFAAEQRPWIALGRPEIAAMYSDGVFNVLFQVKAENIGNSPAFQVELFSRLYLTPIRKGENDLLIQFTQENPPSSMWQNNQRIIFPKKERPLTDYLEEDEGVSLGNLQNLKVVYAVRYQSATGNQSFVTVGEVVFSVHRLRQQSQAGELHPIKTFSYYGVGYAT